MLYKECRYPSTPLPAFFGKDFPEVLKDVCYARQPAAICFHSNYTILSQQHQAALLQFAGHKKDTKISG